MADTKKPAGKSGSSDFDLDSFINSLDLDTPKPKRDKKNQSTTLVKYDPNSTMSYQAVGENPPELPFVDEKDDVQTASRSGSKNRPQKSSRPDSSGNPGRSNNSKPGSDVADLNNALEQTSSGSKKRRANSKRNNSSDNTKTYKGEDEDQSSRGSLSGQSSNRSQSGQFGSRSQTSKSNLSDKQSGNQLNQDNNSGQSSHYDKDGQSSQSSQRNRERNKGSQPEQGNQREQSTQAKKSNKFNKSSQPGQTSKSGQPSKPSQSSQSSQSGKSTQSKTSSSKLEPLEAVEKIGAGIQDAVKRVASVNSNTETRTVHNPLDNSDILVADSAYKPLDFTSTTYQIRGGGSARKKSPIMNLVLAVVVIIGIVLLGYGVYNITGLLAGTGVGASIDLSATQTRDAIDKRLPVVVSIVDAGFDDVQTALQDSGQHLFANSRYLPDSPDLGAQGRELISVPGQMTDAQIQGFFEGAYNAYSPTELAEFFNGAFVLDMTRGDNGAWNKLKYVNLNATSIEDEISRLRTLQELTGDSAIVAAQGTDSRGNNVVQGTKAIGDTVLYWKIAACPFSEIYSATMLNGNAVYITCTVATYDFYTGADKIS